MPSKDKASAKVKEVKDTKKTKVKVEEKPKKSVKSKDSKSKDAKKNKYADVEKGDAPNKATAFSGLTFNVSESRKWLKEYLSRYKVEKKRKNTAGVAKSVHEPVKIKSAHFAITAADQVLCLSLVSLADKKSKKATAGLRTVTEEILMDSMRASKDFMFAFGKWLDAYSSQDNYSKQLGLTKDIIVKFIEKFLNSGDTSLHIDDQCFNLLSYILLKHRIVMAETAFQMVSYANKSSVDGKSILYAIKTMHTGGLCKDITKKIEEVMSIINGSKKSNGSDSDDSKGDKPKKKSDKSEKGGKKESDDENDEEEKSEAESSSSDESDDGE